MKIRKRKTRFCSFGANPVLEAKTQEVGQYFKVYWFKQRAFHYDDSAYMGKAFYRQPNNTFLVAVRRISDGDLAVYKYGACNGPMRRKVTLMRYTHCIAALRARYEHYRECDDFTDTFLTENRWRSWERKYSVAKDFFPGHADYDATIERYEQSVNKSEES